MVARIFSAGLSGIDGYIVTVECFLSGGLPRLDVVGLPTGAVSEAGERVRAAAEALGYRTRSVARTGGEGRRSNLIALLLADISNPVFFELIRGAEAAATDAGYTVLLNHTRESDQLARVLLTETPATELEISRGGLEDAFTALVNRSGER